MRDGFGQSSRRCSPFPRHDWHTSKERKDTRVARLSCVWWTRGDNAHPVHIEPARGRLRWELRKDLLVEPPQLSHLVLYGPQKYLSDPCSLELEQFFGALSRSANRQSLPQLLDRAAKRWTNHLHQQFFGQAPVLCKIVEHRAQRVWEASFLPPDLMQRLVQERQRVGERRWSDVIGGSEPAISQASDPAQASLRSPAANPNGHARLLSRKGFEWCRGFCIELASERWGIALQETAQELDRLVKALPTFLEGNAHQGVILGQGTRTDTGDQTATGENVKGGQGLCQRDGSAYHRQRHRRHERHVTCPGEDGGQRRDTIEPGTGEGEMIVGAQGGEAKQLRRLSIVNQA